MGIRAKVEPVYDNPQPPLKEVVLTVDPFTASVLRTVLGKISGCGKVREATSKLFGLLASIPGVEHLPYAVKGGMDTKVSYGERDPYKDHPLLLGRPAGD